MAFNLFDTPDYYTGLLGEEATQKLQNKALGTGLVNAALAFIAQPRNQRYGSALPYLGKALMGGYQAGQDVIQGGLRDYETQQKIKQLQAQREAVAKVSAENPELGRMLEAYPTAAPGVLEKLYSPREAKPVGQLLTQQEAAAQGLPTDQGQRWQRKPDQTFELVSGTGPTKEASLTEEPNRVAIAKFKKPFNQLTPEEAQQVNDYIENRQLRVAQAGVPSQQPGFKDAGELRKEYNALPQIKAFGEVQNAFDQIQSGVNATSPAGDLAAATKFMKLLDPGSVVRESELGMAMAATGLLDRALQYKNYVLNGTKLSPSQRQDFLNVSTQLYNAAKARKDEIDSQYTDIARQGGLNPNLILRTPGSSGGAVKDKIMQELKRRNAGG